MKNLILILAILFAPSILAQEITQENLNEFYNKFSNSLTTEIIQQFEGVISKVEKVTHNIIYEAKISYLDGRNTKAKLTRVVSSYSLIAPEINFEYNSPPIKGIEKIDDKVYFGDKVRIEGVESFMLLRETWTDSLGNVTNEIVHNEENPNDVKTETFINQLSQYILEGIKNFNTD